MNALEVVKDLMVEDRKIQAIRAYRMIVGAARGYTPGLLEGKARVEDLMKMTPLVRWASVQEEFATYIKTAQEEHEDFWSPEATAKRYEANRDEALIALMNKKGWDYYQADDFLSDVESCVSELYFIFPGAMA
jgi:hypothetical protein